MIKLILAVTWYWLVNFMSFLKRKGGEQSRKKGKKPSISTQINQCSSQCHETFNHQRLDCVLTLVLPNILSELVFGAPGISTLLLSDWRAPVPVPRRPVAQQSSVDAVQPCEGGGVLLRDVCAGEEESVSVPEVRHQGPAPQVQRSLAVSCYGTVSTIIQLHTSSPTGRNHGGLKKNKIEKMSWWCWRCPDYDEGCAGVDQDVRADSVTLPGPQYLGVGTTLLQTVAGTTLTGSGSQI